MNFEDQLQNALNINNAASDETQFIDRLHATQHKLELQQARFQSSIATAVLLLIFGWASFAQLNDSIFDIGYEQYYSYDDDYDYISEIDSSDYDVYVADMALYLLDEDDVWDVLEFFEEEKYEYAFNTKEIKL